jgi:YHS domain-containing protein
MIDFLAEAAVLVGLLTYARSRPELEEPAEKESRPGRREESSADPRRKAKAADASGPAPESPASGAAAALDTALGAARRAWTSVTGWFSPAADGAEPRMSGSSPTSPRRPQAPSGKPAASQRSAERNRPPAPTGRTLWGAQTQYGAPARAPEEAPPRRASTPAPPSSEADPTRRQAQGGTTAGASAAQGSKPGGPPAIVRDPVCGLELPWSRSISLRVGGDTFYFCSDACRALYARGHKDG